MSMNPAIIFAASAMSNPKLVTGEALDWQLRVWFGDKQWYKATREEIAARQAYEYSKAMCEYLKNS